ncbi:MAG TPA: ADP-ribosylation factor-like protein [Thermoanaerobaculia bacterium]|jgi:signal recognition particle receptor subunit beta
MVLFNHATREMTAKIVYYGPGLCGKTTNLMVIFDKLDPKQKGKMLSLATKTDRTLFFDLLPVDIGKVGAFNLKIQLYTVPGQVFYNETRKLVLKGADSVVFVADSQPAMVDATRESFANLLDNLEENNLDPNDIPIVIQYNKRDIPGVLPVEALQEALGFEGYPYTEASAIKGQGVMETFKLVSKITAKHLMNRLKGGKADAAPKKTPTAPGVEKPAAKPAPVAESPASEPTPAFASSAPVAEELPLNPFADSIVTDSGYEAMEEVSLEQLLEGRERPATLSGAVPVPLEALEEIEELAPEEVVEEPSVPVAFAEEPSTVVHADAGNRIVALEAEVQQLKSKLTIMRDEQRNALEAILQELNDLTERVRAQLEA